MESRRPREIEALIVRHGGLPFVAPSVEERPIEANEEIFAWAERLFAGDFDVAVFMTGAGLAYVRDAIAARYPLKRFVEALRGTTVVSRGPQPQAILNGLGLNGQVNVPEPETWREMVPLLAACSKRRITLQEYGKANMEFASALQALGASVTSLAVHRWELPGNVEPLREAARRIAARDCDVVVFTTSVQLAHLLRVAAELELEKSVLQALSRDLVIASVGPITDEALAERGLKPDISPAHPRMGALMRKAAEQSVEAMARKRAGALPRFS